MKKAQVFVNDHLAGFLFEIEKANNYQFEYLENYSGSPVSLTIPLNPRIHHFDHFPVFFEGFLPEGLMLEGLLKKTKLDSDDLFEQLVRVGSELVGNVTILRCF